MLKPVHSA